MNHEQFINKLKQKLKETLPGEEAQYAMAPLNRRRIASEDSLKGRVANSAVMLLICRDENDNLFIPLTQRYTYDGAHSGQISLPGGKFDAGDADLTNTALRECDEEIGIRPDEIEIIGSLTPLFIPVSSYLVQPVIGFCGIKNIAFNKNEREVKSIIKLFLAELLDENIIKSGSIETSSGEKIKAPYFEIEGLTVWGATAMMLNEFKALLLR